VSAQPVELPKAADVLGVKPDTVRAWLRRGAPCVEPGSNGPGKSAKVDVEALRRWRGRSADDAPLVTVDGAAVARGLLRAYRSGTHAELGIGNRQAAALYAEAFVDIVRETTGHPPAPPYPADIATLIAIAIPSRHVHH
jgi:hypothetical protein